MGFIKFAKGSSSSHIKDIDASLFVLGGFNKAKKK